MPHIEQTLTDSLRQDAMTPWGSRFGDVRVAVLVPCYNEALTIEQVVRGFSKALPGARVFVFDNCSSDDTVGVARRAGAIVRQVADQGKGNVIRRMFADADVYVLGDDTYDAAAAPSLVNSLLTNGLDMVVGARRTNERSAYRMGHRFGNRLLTRCVATLFGRTFTDMLSGYRVFSRRYAKSFPAHAVGFETETELTVHALELRMPVGEIETRYGSRPEGSESKLNTYRDGWRSLLTILKLFKTERPLMFFSICATGCAVVSVLLAVPLVEGYIKTGLVPPAHAVLCAAIMQLGALLLTCGIVLDTVTYGRRKVKRLPI